jgi:hypothetical protein
VEPGDLFTARCLGLAANASCAVVEHRRDKRRPRGMSSGGGGGVAGAQAPVKSRANGSDEQMFGAVEQVPHGGPKRQRSEKPYRQTRGPLQMEYIR